MVRYLYISKYTLFGHVPQKDQICVIDGKTRIWTVAENFNWFVINSYAFTDYIFCVDDIAEVEEWDTVGKRLHVLINKALNVNEKLDILFQMKTDIDLNVSVYFDSDINKVVRSIIN
tara:strand:- start:58 stop:408 length:351 start_codon:yes stop_codon:yes gene_type:complete